jgi:hypothetical protein
MLSRFGRKWSNQTGKGGNQNAIFFRFINSTLSKDLAGTDFVAVIFGRCRVLIEIGWFQSQ